MTTQTITTTPSTSCSTAIPYTVMTSVASQGSSTSSTLCASPSCPVTHAHDTGIYKPVSLNEMSPEARRMFKPSIPPAHVLAAFERCLHEGMSKEDVKFWVSFHESHTEPLIDDIHLRWVAPVPADQLDEYLDRILSQAKLGSMTTTNNNVARHPFGLTNPPDDVWAAHARLQQGQVDGRDLDRSLVEKDREFVRAFSADSGYCAEGVGKQVANVRRFKVRRLNYVRQLAEIRRRRR